MCIENIEGATQISQELINDPTCKYKIIFSDVLLYYYKKMKVVCALID